MRPFQAGDVVYVKDPRKWIGLTGDQALSIVRIAELDEWSALCEWQQDYSVRRRKWFKLSDLSHERHCEHENTYFRRTALVCSDCSRVVGGF